MTSRTEYNTQTPNKPSLFDVQYLRKYRTLGIGVLGYIGIVWPKEHSPEVRPFPPGTLCVYRVSQEECAKLREVFLVLNYTDITQNTYVQSWTDREIMAREKCGLLAGPRNVPVSWQPYPCPSLSVVLYYVNSAHARNKLFMYFLLGDKAVQVSAWHSCHV